MEEEKTENLIIQLNLRDQNDHHTPNHKREKKSVINSSNKTIF